MMFYGAIDLGGTKIYIVLADEKGAIKARLKIPTAADAGPQIVIEQMVEGLSMLLKEKGESFEQLTAVGVCAAGYFDRRERKMVYSPNLQGWENVPLEAWLSGELGCPVLVENDANAAALGETRCGAAQGKKDVIYLTVSTGIGAGLVLDGQIYRGSRGFAGEAGHIKVNPAGTLCGCGQRGCLETEASGTAIARHAQQTLEEGKARLLKMSPHQAADAVYVPSAKDVFAAARAGDQLACAIIDKALNYLGTTIANMVNLLNPEIIVIGGGVANAGNDLLIPLRKIVRETAIPVFVQNLTIEKATLGVESGVIGMLSLLQNKNT